MPMSCLAVPLAVSAVPDARALLSHDRPARCSYTKEQLDAELEEAAARKVGSLALPGRSDRAVCPRIAGRPR